MITEKEHQIIGMIYEAVLDHQWDKVLAEIVAYTNSYSGILTVLDQLDPMSDLIYTHNLPQDLVKIYKDEELRILDMQIHQPKIQQVGGVGHTLALDWATYASMPDSKEYTLYKKCIQPSGVRFVVGMLLEEGQYRWGLLGIHRTAEMPSYTERECIKLEHLAVHFRRALQIYRQFNVVRQKLDDDHQILDHLKIGVMMVDSCNRLVYANKTAKGVLENSPSMLWVDHSNQLKTKDTFQAQLDQHIASVFLQPSHVDDVGGMLILYEQATTPLLKLSITPLSRGSISVLNTHEHEDQAMIFITTMQQYHQLSVAYLSQNYELTKREIKICELFINGKSLEEIATALSITLSSLRTYFKYIYEKTHCSSQAELVHLLYSLIIEFNHID